MQVLDTSTSNTKTKYLARYVQKYYTVRIDYPIEGPAGFYTVFPDSFANNKAPVFVRNVTYGRMILFTFESSSSETEVKAMLEASLDVTRYSRDRDRF